MAILEHKVKWSNVERVIKKITPNWNWSSNCAYSKKGRIILMWNPNFIIVTIGDVQAKFFHSTVQILSSRLEFQFTAMVSILWSPGVACGQV